MRFRTQTPRVPFLALLLVLSAAGAAGCGTENVEADIAFLSNGTASPSTGETWFEVVFRPTNSVPEGTEYSLRVDGKRLLISTEDPSPVIVSPGTHAGRRADNLAGGAHVVELLTPGGKVALTTSPLTLLPGRGNQLVVFGDVSALRYDYFDNPTAVSDAVPAGSILARVINLRADGQSLNFLSCPVGASSTLDCTPGASGLAYGDIWERVITRDRTLAMTCEPLNSVNPCWGVSFPTTCGTLGGALVEPKVKTIVVAAANGFFELYDVGGLQTCVNQ